MAKLTTTDLSSLANETSAVNVINANNALVETALENTLSRDGTSPNTMSADLDMNGNDILNVGALLFSGNTTVQDALISTPDVTVDNSIARWNGIDGSAIDDTTGWTISDVDLMTAGGNLFMASNNISTVTSIVMTGGGFLEGTGGIFKDFELQDYSETAYNAGNLTGNVSLDYSNGPYQYGTATGNFTITGVTNWPASGKVGSMTLEVTQDATGSRTISHDTEFKFTGNGTAPTLSTGGTDVDMLVYWTRDGGTTVYVNVAGQDYA